MPVVGLHWLPEDVERVVRHWANCGINIFGDLMKRGTLMQKQDLEWKLSSKIMWMHNFQLRAVLNSPKCKSGLEKDPTEFECLLRQGDGSTKHKLSAIYKMLLAFDKTCLSNRKKKWKQDCHVSFSEERWASLFHHQC